ncbi:MAG: hypothetical protein JST00_05515 [Deltaproteobacteria bacterium]|nr:hypothetical protein [Deltaproteobacteria bacterium]
MRKKGWLVVGAVPVALLAWGGWGRQRPVEPHATASTPAPVASASAAPVAPAPPADPSDDSHDDERSYVFRIPSGEPTSLSCEEARTIIDQVRSGLAYTPENVATSAFATSTSDWLDPHGLLTLAKDAPTARAITKAAPELLADIEGRRRRSCDGAMAPAAALEQWAATLREAFDRGRGSVANGDKASAALEPLPPTGSAREIAFEIGTRVGAFEVVHGAPVKRFGDEARRRFFPTLDRSGWAKVVLASAVRAYVPLLDPHGEWAPFDEESRIYEVDLASRPPSRLWGRAVPTAVGVRVIDSPAAPLQADDIVLAVSNVATAGLPLEQVDQLGFAATEGAGKHGDSKLPLSAVVLRDKKIITLELGKPEEGSPPSRVAGDLPSERIPYGEGDLVRVEVKDVRDDLGDDLAALIATERERAGRKLTGVVIDLRGNGGGSTDGAISALSLFLPGASLFAMKRRDGTIDIDRAPLPRDRDRWNGPVATLVDGSTASAAEMIAGALAAYKRGPTIGTTTFGKGCAQEYIDDDAHAGVLRLTTLVYALPDGSPVQRVGLQPQIRFPFTLPGDPSSNEREAKLPHAAPPWRGPDLREPTTTKAAETPWPAHAGVVGPCRDAEVCKALRLLGPKRPSIAKH